MPRALDEAGISRLREAFAAASERATRAGFGILGLRTADGYLMHQLLFPLTNLRSDF